MNYLGASSYSSIDIKPHNMYVDEENTNKRMQKLAPYIKKYNENLDIRKLENEIKFTKI